MSFNRNCRFSDKVRELKCFNQNATLAAIVVETVFDYVETLTPRDLKIQRKWS